MGEPSRSRLMALALSLAVVLQLAGCPARRTASSGTAAAPDGEVGPPSVLNPDLLDRG